MTLRLPAFDLHTPATLYDAVRLIREAEGDVAFIAGGTDLVPRMKRRQTTPVTVISLTRIPTLSGIQLDDDGLLIIGSGTPLVDVAASRAVPRALVEAAAAVGSPQVRSTATVGGNLCLDTRCNYNDMPELWRDARGPCLKGGGDTCWAAPKSDRCWAINSSDLAPAAIALDATIRLTGVAHSREVSADDFYRNDGIDRCTLTPDEILVEVAIPPGRGRSAFRKLRRRGSIDFALVNVAAAITMDGDTCSDARIVVGAVASAPIRAHDAETSLIGDALTPDTIGRAAELASKPIRTFDNTDMGARYRKWMVPVMVRRTLTALLDTDTTGEQPHDG